MEATIIIKVRDVSLEFTPEELLDFKDELNKVAAAIAKPVGGSINPYSTSTDWTINGTGGLTSGSITGASTDGVTYTTSTGSNAGIDTSELLKSLADSYKKSPG